MLPEWPLTVLATDPLDRQRLCLRPDWAPPQVIPAACVQLYVAPSHSSDSFGVAVVLGGDAELDASAVHLADGAARLTLATRDPLYRGASQRSALHATLAATVTALEMLAAQGGDAPVLLRIADPRAMAVVVGVMAPPRDVSRLAASVLTRLRAAQADRTHVWVAGFDLDRPYPWGERAQALAGYSAEHGCWGQLPAQYAAAQQAPLVPPWTDELCCPVCLEFYDDLWPAAAGVSRAPSGRWACSHAVCRACDPQLQHGANSRCPMCRADRRVFMQP